MQSIELNPTSEWDRERKKCWRLHISSFSFFFFCTEWKIWLSFRRVHIRAESFCEWDNKNAWKRTLNVYVVDFHNVSLTICESIAMTDNSNHSVFSSHSFILKTFLFIIRLFIIRYSLFRLEYFLLSSFRFEKYWSSSIKYRSKEYMKCAMWKESRWREKKSHTMTKSNGVAHFVRHHFNFSVFIIHSSSLTGRRNA